MKLTPNLLRKLIKEELENLKEADQSEQQGLDAVKNDVSKILNNVVQYKNNRVEDVISAVYFWANEKNKFVKERPLNKAQDLTAIAAQLKKDHNL